MHSHIMGLMEFSIADLEIHEDEAVFRMVNAHNEKDEDAFKKAFQEYKEYHRLVRMGYEMADGGIETWNWQWLADTGNLCDQDWVWFEKQLKEAGVDKEAFYEKWK